MRAFWRHLHPPKVLKESLYVLVSGGVPLVQPCKLGSQGSALEPCVRSSDGVCERVSVVRHSISNPGKEVHDAYW